MAFRRIALGTAAISSVSILRLLAQFFVVPILSRLLSPADYGIVAMAMPFVIFTMIFTDAGVGQSLVRAAQKEQPDVWSTSFWFTLLSGTALTALIVCLAPLAAMFFNEPRLKPIVMALAFVIIPQGGATIPEAALRQDQRFGTIAATEITAVFTGILLAVAVGMSGGGAWALVAQQLGLYGTRFISTLLLSSFRPQAVFRLGKIKDHLMFGRDVIAAKFVWFLTSAMDGPIVGKVLGASMLGLYTMAFMFARLPGQVISGPLQYVIYGHLGPMGDDRPALRRIYLLLTRLLATVIFPGLAMVAAAHNAVFKIFLSEKWLPSGTLFMLATPAAALTAVTMLRGTFMMLIGRTGVQLRSAIEYFLLLGAALLGFIWLGIDWFVIGYNLATFAYFPRSVNLLLRDLGCTFAEYARTLVVPALAAAACVALYAGLNLAFSPGDWGQLFLGGFIGVLGIAAGFLAQYRALSSDLALLRENW